MRTIFAHCDASGVIKFGEVVPEGSLPIVKGEEVAVRELISVVGRHAYPRTGDHTQVFLVPGIPEAPDQERAMDALLAFRAWISKRKDPRFDFMNGSAAT